MGNIQLVRSLKIVINGRQIGYVMDWKVIEPQLEADVELAYEVGRDGPIPNEIARSAYKGGTIDLKRFVLWNEELQDAIGYDVQKLTDIMDPFICEEHIEKPDNTIKVNSYTGCLFGPETWESYANDRRAVRVWQSATIHYEYKKRIR